MAGLRAFVTCRLPEGSLEPLVAAGIDVAVRDVPGPASAKELAQISAQYGSRPSRLNSSSLIRSSTLLGRRMSRR